MEHILKENLLKEQLCDAQRQLKEVSRRLKINFKCYIIYQIFHQNIK